MHIKYKIVKVTPADHSLVVRFYTDTISEDFLAIRNPNTQEILRNPDGTIQACRTDYSITLWDTPTLSGTALHDFIMQSAPVQWFELLEKVANPLVDTSMLAAVDLVGIETVGEAVVLT